jgi:hypothetical protein
MQPLSARVPLRTRRRAAALGEGAHQYVMMHEQMMLRGEHLPAPPFVKVRARFDDDDDDAEQRPGSPPRLASVSVYDGGRQGASWPGSRGSPVLSPETPRRIAPPNSAASSRPERSGVDKRASAPSPTPEHDRMTMPLPAMAAEYDRGVHAVDRDDP